MPTVKPSRPVINKTVIRVSVTMGETKRGWWGERERERETKIYALVRGI